MKKTASILAAAVLLVGAQSAAAIDCEMDFSMSGFASQCALASACSQ